MVGSSGFSSIGTGCCKSRNLDGLPLILGFRAASATATTNGMDLSRCSKFIVGGGLILFCIWSSTFWSTGRVDSGWAEDSLDSSVVSPKLSFKVWICLSIASFSSLRCGKNSLSSSSDISSSKSLLVELLRPRFLDKNSKLPQLYCKKMDKVELITDPILACNEWK